MKVALLCMVLAFAFAVFIAPILIKLIIRLKVKQNILHYVDKHALKQGTPTMGGLIFLISLIIVYFVVGGYNSILATIILCATLGYALVGLLDDYLKIRHKDNLGLKAYQKALGQLGISVIIAIFIYRSRLVGGEIVLPFSFASIDVDWAIIPFVIFIFLAVTNAVNLTDGLDGLASGVSVSYLLSFSIVLSIYITNLKNSGENAVTIGEYTKVMQLCFILAGAVLGYMCFNAYPAKIFMGDAGSLAIGGFIACSMAVTKLYLYMPLIGLMFVLSTISVVLQVGYYKMTHKRIFRMAPLHHHFEQLGVHETKVVAIYIIVTVLLGVLCIALSL